MNVVKTPWEIVADSHAALDREYRLLWEEVGRLESALLECLRAVQTSGCGGAHHVVAVVYRELGKERCERDRREREADLDGVQATE